MEFSLFSWFLALIPEVFSFVMATEESDSGSHICSLTSSALSVLSLTFGDWKDREKINCPNIDPLCKVGATWLLAACRKADNPPLAAGKCHVVLSWRPVITSLAMLMTHIQSGTESLLGLRVQWWWLIQTSVWALIGDFEIPDALRATHRVAISIY